MSCWGYKLRGKLARGCCWGTGWASACGWWVIALRITSFVYSNYFIVIIIFTFFFGPVKLSLSETTDFTLHPQPPCSLHWGEAESEWGVSLPARLYHDTVLGEAARFLCVSSREDVKISGKFYWWGKGKQKPPESCSIWFLNMVKQSTEVIVNLKKETLEAHSRSSSRF